MSFLSSVPILPTLGGSWQEKVALSLGGLVALALALYLYMYPYREWVRPFRNLNEWANEAGPKPESFLWGSLPSMFRVEPGVMHTKWQKTYGLTYRYRTLFGMARICTVDPTTVNYILTHADQFPKPEMTRKTMANMLGNGVLVAEGPDHRRQRRVLNPSFSPQSIRDVLPMFYDKAYELKEKMLGIIEDDPTGEAAPGAAKENEKSPGGRKMDVMKFLGKCTIDIIGIAGFNYDFKALSQPENELANAFSHMFAAGQGVTLMAIVQSLVPYMDLIPTKRMNAIRASQATTQRIGRRLIQDKKKAIAEAHAGGLEKGHDIGKDLLSSCIRANMAADLKSEQKMSDDEVLAQITTFMLAGNETSSTALTWLLYAITQNPAVQDRLRKECLEVEDDRPSVETLHSLPYMEAVVRETLRLLSPVPGTVREAAADIVVPMSEPVKGRDGKMMDSVKISKGTGIFLCAGAGAYLAAISTMNTNPDIWGEDAEVFNPDRHLPPRNQEHEKERQAVPGVWGNILTFLGGTRNCIGYRFALAEIKAILFVLMRGFTFEELESKPKIEKKSAIVMRPRVIGEEADGLQLPLMVKPLAQN